MRPALFVVTMGATLALAGCADFPTFGSHAPGGVRQAANADHPRAEAVLSRESRASVRDAAREPAHDRAHEPAPNPAASLREGIRLYNEGDFANAIARLGAADSQNATAATRTTALKYTAFSYCVTQRPLQCRQAFDKALRIDASFALAPGEEGHPMWGPVFDKARAAR